MIKTIKSALALAFMLCMAAAVNAQSTNRLLGVIDKSKVVFTYENELRMRDNDNNTPLFYDHNDIQAKYLVNDYLDLFTDYRLVLQDKGTGGFKDTSMFLEGFDLKLPEGRYGKLNLRSRLELSLAPRGAQNTYYLNEFPKYDFPIKLTRFQIQPFVADESFWDCANGAEFVKNRIYAGLDWQITPKVKGGTWYYYETTRGAPFSQHADVAVMQIRFEL